MDLLSKIKITLLLLLFVFMQKVNAQYYATLNKLDTNKYIRFGVVPYQFLSRSSGLYIAYQFKNCEFEFRPTYTIRTKNLSVPYMTGIKNDRYFYQGLNNNFLFQPNLPNNEHFRLILIYRLWWFKNQKIPVDGVSLSSSYSFSLKQNAFLQGPGGGIEYKWDGNNRKFDCNFYFNLTQSFLFGERTILSGYAGYFGNQKPPITEKIHRFIFNLTFGLELGYKKINSSSH